MKIIEMVRDGWDNIITGLGRKSADTTRSTQSGAIVKIVEENELGAIYLTDGLGAKIVRCRVDDGLRPWFEIEADPENVLVKEMDRLDFRETLKNAGYWAQLYGGALVVIGFADGLTLDQPRANGKQVTWVRQYPGTRVYSDTADLGNDPTSEMFQKPVRFWVTMENGMRVEVHHTRAIMLKGVAVPLDAYGVHDQRMRYWGMSVLQQAYERLAALGASFQGLDNLVQKFAVGKYKLAGLREAISGGKSDLVFKRMEIMNASASLLNGVFLDAEGGEDFTRDVVSFGGVTEYLDRAMMALCACPNVPPITRLFGRSPAGLNATGESDLKTYYDDVENWQSGYMKHPAELVAKLVNAGMGSPIADKDVTVKWGKPLSMTQSEELEARSKQANIDKIYIDAQVYDSGEVRQSRFVGGYSYSTQIESDTAPEPLEKPAKKAVK